MRRKDTTSSEDSMSRRNTRPEGPNPRRRLIGPVLLSAAMAMTLLSGWAAGARTKT